MIEIENLYCMRGCGDQAFSIHVPYLNIQPGELIAITGVSGSGKSTLLEILGLILPPQIGALHWQLSPQRNIDISNLWQKYPEQLNDLRMRYLGFVLQTGGLLPFLTVQENIFLPKQLLQQDEVWDEELQSIIEQLDILHLLTKKPYQLSIGERQRVAIARALAHHPLLLLADEPTSALDPGRAEGVMQLFVDLIRSQNRTAVIVTHDYSWIGRLGLREVRASLESGGKIACFN
jgi:putative ABC transport system ATP-binding protein